MVNRKTILSAMLILLMAAAYAPAIPVNAQIDQGVLVLTQVTTVNNTIYFAINVTYLRNTLGWVGTTFDIYVSSNGYATLDNSVRLVRGIYVPAGTEYIAGTLFINKTVIETLYPNTTSDNVTLFVKVTDGSNVVASNRFTVVLNVSGVIQLNTHNLSMTSFDYGSFESNNTLELYMNVSKFVDPNFNLSNYNITLDLYNSLEDKILYERYKTQVNNTTVWVEESDVLTLATTNVTKTSLYVKGDLKNFSLAGVNANLTLLDYMVAYERFLFRLQAIDTNRPYYHLNNTIIVDNNTLPYDSQLKTYNLSNVTLNIGSIDQYINIYPSAEVKSTDPTLAGSTTELNPGDNITVALYNYVNSTDTITICLFVEGVGKIVSIPTNATVNATYGNATVTVTLPEAQYGGRTFYVVAKQGTNVRGLPSPTRITVVPYLDISVVRNNGTFAPFNSVTDVAPGDYLLVKGHGFMKENITVKAYYNGTPFATLQFLLDITGANKTVVQDNGTFFSMYKIPPTADSTKNPFIIVAEGETTTNKGSSIIAFNFTFGKTAKVFVNPVPRLLTGYGYTPEAGRIDQLPVTPAYPYAIPDQWKDQLTGGVFNFTVEAIGINFTSGNITITSDNTTYWVVISVDIVNGYYYNNDVPVPVAPYGDYYVVVNDTANKFSTYEKIVYIRETARAIDPVELLLHNTTVYTLQVFLGEAMNITVLGYGWPGNANVQFIIHKVGTTLTNTTDVITTAANGTFNATAHIANFLEAHGEGNYTLTIYYNDTVEEIITIYYAITPNFTVEVHSGTLKLTYPGDVVDVYAILRLGGKLLDPTVVNPYKLEVKVTVYYYNGTGLVKLIDSENMTYTGEPGIWHYRFSVPADVKGDELLIKVYGEVQPKFFMLPRKQVVFTSLTVAGSLEDLFKEIEHNINKINETIVNVINETLSKLNLTITSIGNKIVVVSETLNETYADVSYLVMLANAINANLTLVYSETQALSGQISNATESINESIGNLYLALVAYGNSLLSNQAVIIAKLNLSLEKLDALLVKVDNNTALILSKIGSLEANVTMLITDLNATLVALIQNSTGQILGLIQTKAGCLKATMKALHNLTIKNITIATQQVLDSIASLNTTMTDYYGEIMSDLGIIKSNLTKLDTIMSKIDSAKQSIMSEVDSKASDLSNKIDAAKSDVENMLGSKIDAVSSKVDAVSTKIDNSTKTLSDLINTKAKSITDTLSAKIDSLGNQLSTTSQNLTKLVTDTSNSVKGRVTTMTSLSTVVLLAAVIAVGFVLSGGRRT